MKKVISIDLGNHMLISVDGQPDQKFDLREKIFVKNKRIKVKNPDGSFHFERYNVGEKKGQLKTKPVY